MSNNPIRQHTVPRFLIKRFANSDGKLYEIRNVADGWFPCSTSNASAKEHIYTIRDQNGSKDYFLENHLSAVEGRAAPAIERIEQLGLDKSSDEDRQHLANFIAWQYYRTKRMKSAVDRISAEISTSENNERLLDENIDELRKLRSESEIAECREQIRNGEALLARKDAFAKYFLTAVLPGLAEALYWMSWRTERVHRSVTRFFVCSDTPVAIRRRGCFDEARIVPLDDPNAEAYFPLSRTTMLIASNIGGRNSKIKSKMRVAELNKILIANRCESVYSPPRCNDVFQLMSQIGDFRIPVPEPTVQDL